MKKIIIIAIAIFIAGPSISQGIDPQFSSYYMQPLQVNPALTGVMESKWRMTTTFREQDYVIAQPFISGMGSFDINLPINAWAGNIWGFGINYIYDDQGDARIRNNRINLSASVGQYLDPREEHSISVGFMGGIGTRSINYDNVYWESQWIGTGFATFIGSGETLPAEARGYFDLSTGAQYSYRGEITNLNIGYGMFHANRPDNSLYIDTNEFRLERRHTVHGMLESRFTEDNMFALRPSFMFTRQGKINNLIFGSDFVFFFNEPTRTTGKRKEYSMSLGLHHRWMKDVVGSIAFNLAGFYMGSLYDISVSRLSELNGYQGAYEIFIGYRAGFRSGSNSRYAPFKKGKL